MPQDRDAPPLVDGERHAVRDVLADHDLRRATRQEVFLRHQALAVREHPLRQLHLHVPGEIVRARPHASRRPHRHDRFVQVDPGPSELSVHVLGVRLRHVPLQSAREVESRIGHTERFEDPGPHCFVVGGAQLLVRVGEGRTDISRRGRHEVAVLEDLAEVARRLHGPEEFQCRRRRRLPVLEEPLHVLAGHAGARADEMLHEHLTRRSGVAELECRVHVGDGLVPAQLLLVHELGEEQRRHCLGVGRGDEERIGVDLVRFAELLHPEAALEDDLPAIDQAEADARHTELLHPAGDEVLHLSDPLLIQGMRLLPGEALALIPPGTKAQRGQAELRATLLERRVRGVDENRNPGRLRSPRLTEDGRALVGRSLVLVELPLLPAVLGGLRLNDLQRTLRVRAIGGPGGGDRRIGILRSGDVDDHEMRIGLRRIQHDHGAACRHGPLRRKHERRARGCRSRTVGGGTFDGRRGGRPLRCALRFKGRSGLGEERPGEYRDEE